MSMDIGKSDKCFVLFCFTLSSHYLFDIYIFCLGSKGLAIRINN